MEKCILLSPNGKFLLTIPFSFSQSLCYREKRYRLKIFRLASLSISLGHFWLLRLTKIDSAREINQLQSTSPLLNLDTNIQIQSCLPAIAHVT